MTNKTQNSTKTLFLPDVGDVLFKRNTRAKRLTIYIRPNAGVRVTVPRFLPFITAKKFVEQKKDWILEKQTHLSKQNALLCNNAKYKTREHTLNFISSETNKILIDIENGNINVKHPCYMDIKNSLVQNAAKEAIELAYRKEAIEHLPKRVGFLASKYGFQYNHLRIKNIKSRWGSCSTKNNINLSIYLMKLPDELIDFIILHELTHTIHKNHGASFWNHLNKLTGNAKALSARVKKYRTGI